MAQQGKARAAQFRARHGYRALTEHGYLRETGIVQSIGCEECDSPHDAEVIFEGGEYGFNCPDLGFVPVARDDVCEVVLDLPRVVSALANAFACKRRKTSPVQGETWRIGAVDTAGGDVTLYLHPRLAGKKDWHNVTDALSREVQSAFRLIVTVEGKLPIQNAEVVRLCDTVDFDHEGSALVASVDPAIVVGAPLQRAGGAPNRYGSQLMQIIRSRAEKGTALEGRNEEAIAILETLSLDAPNTSPSLSTIKHYLTRFRTGQ